MQLAGVEPLVQAHVRLSQQAPRQGIGVHDTPQK
jgi:hypothetical protein